MNDFVSMTILGPVCLNLSASESLITLKGINRGKADKTSMHLFYVLHFSHCLLPLFSFRSFSILKALMQKNR